MTLHTNQCQSGLGGIQCGLTEGHEGAHQIITELTPDIGQLIEEYVTSLEQARERMEKVRRHYRISFLFMLIAAGVNLLALGLRMAGS